MGYSTEEDMVRVDFFKSHGKWVETIQMKWIFWEDVEIHKAFRLSLFACVGNRFAGMTAVCLEPYHKYAHPIMIREWDGKE